MTGLLLLANEKGNSYDLILAIVNRLTKMVYYKLVKVIIDAPKLTKVIIDVARAANRKSTREWKSVWPVW